MSVYRAMALATLAARLRPGPFIVFVGATVPVEKTAPEAALHLLAARRGGLGVVIAGPAIGRDLNRRRLIDARRWRCLLAEQARDPAENSCRLVQIAVRPGLGAADEIFRVDHRAAGDHFALEDFDVLTPVGRKFP